MLLTGLAFDGAKVFEGIDERGRRVVGQTLLDDGTPYVSFGTFVSVADALAGSDGFGVNALIAIQEAASGAETLSTAVALAILENVSAAENLAVALQLTIADTAMGTDAIGVNQGDQASINVTDLAQGVEQAQIANAIEVIEAAAGADNPVVMALQTLSDALSGVDQVAVQTVLSITEAALGADSVQADQVGSLQDSGQASETIAISVVLAVLEQATGSDALLIVGNKPVISVTFDYNLLAATNLEEFI